MKISATLPPQESLELQLPSKFLLLRIHHAHRFQPHLLGIFHTQYCRIFRLMLQGIGGYSNRSILLCLR